MRRLPAYVCGVVLLWPSLSYAQSTENADEEQVASTAESTTETDAAAPAAEATPPETKADEASAPSEEAPPPESIEDINPADPEHAVGPESADAAAAWGNWAEEVEGAPEADTPIFESRLYGFIDSYWEQVGKTPARDPQNPSRTIYESNPYEFDVLNLHAMVQGSIMGRYRFFLNLAAPGSGSPGNDSFLGVRNAWVEAPIVTQYLNLRMGKTYRRFGLYNEILDATPTFIGIEPPEMFDKDHLLLTRTTNLMLFGSVEAGPAVIYYSAATGNDERINDAIPLSFDVYAEMFSWLRIGTSFYTSGGDAAPTHGVGEGSPNGGVLNWMERDSFYVFGGYAQVMHDSGLIAQLEFWQANHSAVRDPASVSLLGAEAGLDNAQLDRFFVGGDPNGAVRTAANYKVRTAYIRLGWEFTWGDTGSITPYAQADYYENPETIAKKSFGGDNEAGLSDDGKFQKYTAGVVIRPISQVALKVDGSGHVQRFNGSTEFYPELRLSLSYLWSL